MREAGQKIGVVTLKCFRPFPFAAVREALRHVSRVLVIERMMSAGGAGAVSLEVMKALKGTAVDQKRSMRDWAVARFPKLLSKRFWCCSEK